MLFPAFIYFQKYNYPVVFITFYISHITFILSALYSHILQTWPSMSQVSDNNIKVCMQSKGYWHRYPGPRLNIKTVLSTYGDFHDKDKTAVRTSYL